MKRPPKSRILKSKIRRRFNLIVGFFGIATLFLILLIILTAFNRAEINLELKTFEKEIEFEVKITSLSLAKETKPALFGEVISKEKEKEETFKPKNITIKPGRAEGRVTIVNNYIRSQPLVATTRLLSEEGVLFRTKYRIEVPPHDQVTVDVYADKEGPEGDIGPSRFTIPGLWPGLQDKIYGISSQPMKGGLREVGILTEEEISQNKKKQEEELTQEILSQIADEFPNLDTEITKLPLHKEIILSESTAAAGEEVNEYKVKTRLKIIAVIFSKKELINLAKEIFQNQLTKNQELKEILTSTLEYQIKNIDLNKKEAELTVKIKGRGRSHPSSQVLDPKPLVGKSIKEVKEYYKNFPEIQKVEVNLKPFWVFKVPSQLNRIKITIK